jgi:ribosome-associated protein
MTTELADFKGVDSKMSDANLPDANADDAPTAPIKLDQFLKLQGLVGTGGQAKLLIQDGLVLVNGTVETRRGRKLTAGDRISVDGQTYTVGPSTLNG